MSEQKGKYELSGGPEADIKASHALLDEVNVPRQDSQGRERSLGERVAFLIGRHESELKQAESAGMSAVIECLKEGV